MVLLLLVCLVLLSAAVVSGVEDGARLAALLRCWAQCQAPPDPPKLGWITGAAELRAHYAAVLNATAPFRPRTRSDGALYQSYRGPRLEDHFIQHFIGEDPALFFPAVPLFIHWVEVAFGNAGGGPGALHHVLATTLSDRVVYFTVASDYTVHVAHLHIIIASSRGDRGSHIIMPHFFEYQTPGFRRSGQPLVARGPLQEEATPDGGRGWSFANYSDYFRPPAWPNASALRAVAPPQPRTHDQVTVGFVGSLKTHVCRSEMHTMLTPFAAYSHVRFPPHQLCSDASVPGGVGLCWRAAMLRFDVNLSPTGSDPTSYRLYQALQQGAVPAYVFDYRGAWIPYSGTKADLRELAFVVPFGGVAQWMESLRGVAPATILRMRQAILRLRDTHFTPQGAMLQVRRFLMAPQDPQASDLRCCVNPPRRRDTGCNLRWDSKSQPPKNFGAKAA